MRNHSQSAKKNEMKESKIKCLMSLLLLMMADDACRAPHGVILAVISQFVKAFGTNYFLRAISTK
jgi:hypothetical protein